jgi:hypothetical protein
MLPLDCGPDATFASRGNRMKRIQYHRFGGPEELQSLAMMTRENSPD